MVIESQYILELEGTQSPVHTPHFVRDGVSHIRVTLLRAEVCSEPRCQGAGLSLLCSATCNTALGMFDYSFMLSPLSLHLGHHYSLALITSCL